MGEDGPEFEATQEASPAAIARGLVDLDRWNAILTDPQIKEAAKAGIRTIINAGISIADAVPVLGEIPSWLADAGKTVDTLARKVGVKLGVLNTTPDVPLSVALASEAVDVALGGAAPSHAIEGGMQLMADRHRMRAGFDRFKGILLAERNDSKNSPQLVPAMQAFGVA